MTRLSPPSPRPPPSLSLAAVRRRTPLRAGALGHALPLPAATPAPSLAAATPAPAPAAAAAPTPDARTARRRPGSLPHQQRPDRRAQDRQGRQGRARHPDGLTTAVRRHVRPRPQRLDDDQRRARALHDPARPRALLRRAGAPQERPERLRAMPRLRGPRDDPVVGGRLQPRLRQELRTAPVSWAAASTSSSRASTSAPNTDYCYWVSQNVFAMYQLMFAIITPALIVGAIAERMKFTAHHEVHRAVDVPRLLPAGAHGLGRDGLHERHVQRGRQASPRWTSRAARSCTCPRAGAR